MSSSNWSDEEALEAARESGYEDGYDDGNSEGFAVGYEDAEQACGQDAWLDSLRIKGINVLEPFVCRWDAAERRLVVEQEKDDA